MKGVKVIYGIAVFMLFFVSCSENKNEPKSENEIAKEIPQPKIKPQNQAENEIEENVVEEKIEENLSDEALQEKTEKEELKELSKVTFCDCIKKQKELDDRLMETEDDDEMDVILAEMDKLTEGECKNLLADKSTSPEAREERKAKIAACLGK